MEKIIYLDNGATTMVDPKVLDAMLPYLKQYYGNPASVHSLGRNANDAVRNARETISKSINADSAEIFFTSGGTESNNWVLKSFSKSKIITTKIEHKSVLNSCKWLQDKGTEVVYLDVDSEGFVDIDMLKKEICTGALVSVIHGNNEIGTIQNLEQIGNICRSHGAHLHADACQSYTKTEINVKKQNIDFLTLNAHKIHGPKGIGVLYIKKGMKLVPLLHGGGQEKARRSGTVNVPGVVGFAKAVSLGMDKEHVEKMTVLRDKLINGILELNDVKLNGPLGNKRLCNNANFSFKGVEGEALGGYLDLQGICSSTGSACSSKTLEPSHVLRAICLTDEQANGSLRLTLSRFTTEDEIDYVLKVLPGIVRKLRFLSPVGKVIDNVFKKGN